MTSTSITAALPMRRIASVRDCSFSSTRVAPTESKNEDQNRFACDHRLDCSAQRFGQIRGDNGDRIVKFTKDGKYVKEWGKKGTGPREFDIIHHVAFDSKGAIYGAEVVPD